MIKPTDQNKPWNRRKSSKYQIARRDPARTFLIVCEGQTEMLYFESFPVTSLKLEFINMEGKSEQLYIDECKKKVKEYEKQGIKFDEVWCVFDLDIKQGKKQFADFDNAIDSAKKLGYKVAYSNDAFELWYYLHYEYTDQSNHRLFYYEQLGNRWGINYADDGKKLAYCKTVYRKLVADGKANQEQAIERAKKLHQNTNHLPYHKQNPCTTVYELVQSLNKYIKK